MQLPDIAHVEVSGASSCNSGHCLGEVRSLTHSVDSHYNSIIAPRLWKFRDEVNADGVPMFLWDRKWLEFTNRETALRFGVCTQIAVRDILTNVRGLITAPHVPIGTSRNRSDSDQKFPSRIPAK